jgi:surfeit locus 1 family protein
VSDIGSHGQGRGLLVPSILALAAFIVLVALGTWQVERRAWKLGLIAELAERLAAKPAALPASADWLGLRQDSFDFHRVAFKAEFPGDAEALVYTVGSSLRSDTHGPGYWVFAPAHLSDGTVVVVNRGFVPEGRQNPTTRPQGRPSGAVELVGIMRWPDARGWFQPDDDAPHNVFFTRDPGAIAAAKGWGPVAPFYVEQEAPSAPGGLPQVGRLEPNLPNNHLQYAITWYGLAAVLTGVFGFWIFDRRKGPRREHPE